MDQKEKAPKKEKTSKRDKKEDKKRRKSDKKEKRSSPKNETETTDDNDDDDDSHEQDRRKIGKQLLEEEREARRLKRKTPKAKRRMTRVNMDGSISYIDVEEGEEVKSTKGSIVTESPEVAAAVSKYLVKKERKQKRRREKYQQDPIQQHNKEMMSPVRRGSWGTASKLTIEALYGSAAKTSSFFGGDFSPDDSMPNFSTPRGGYDGSPPLLQSSWTGRETEEKETWGATSSQEHEMEEFVDEFVGDAAPAISFRAPSVDQSISFDSLEMQETPILVVDEDNVEDGLQLTRSIYYPADSDGTDLEMNEEFADERKVVVVEEEVDEDYIISIIKRSLKKEKVKKEKGPARRVSVDVPEEINHVRLEENNAESSAKRSIDVKQGDLDFPIKEIYIEDQEEDDGCSLDFTIEYQIDNIESQEQRPSWTKKIRLVGQSKSIQQAPRSRTRCDTNRASAELNNNKSSTKTPAGFPIVTSRKIETGAVDPEKSRRTIGSAKRRRNAWMGAAIVFLAVAIAGGASWIAGR
jgi:hypothetical protein